MGVWLSLAVPEEAGQEWRRGTLHLRGSGRQLPTHSGFTACCTSDEVASLSSSPQAMEAEEDLGAVEGEDEVREIGRGSESDAVFLWCCDCACDP